MATSSGSETRALRHYIADQLDSASDVILAGTKWQNLRTFAQRPKLQKLGSTAAIMVGRIHKKTERVGMGRPTGLKRHSYDISIAIVATASDEQAGGDDFDQLCDQTDIAIEQVILATIINDPESQQQYRLAKIGEEIETTYGDPVQTETGGEVSFTCEKTFTAWIHYNL